ncbi:MAG TPA: phosphoribosylformylglycinamidine cyclo-ligase, partial [Pirellulales bacterium]|nr:phosphoribosylformylglycinamidine cyclo-ligase [Pirellulales bacterium]
MSHDDPGRLEQIVTGITAGCIESDCALLGGETAIMPDLYARGDYDLAGFCVGVVERKRMIDGHAIAEGDIVIGVASSGLHSNGYSLVRRVVFDVAKLNIDDEIDSLGGSVGDALLRPTRIYARAVRAVLANYKVKSVVHGLAHITGGGLHENLERVIPQGVQAIVRRDAWPVPPVFTWLQRLGEIDPTEMDRVFNMGIGLVLVVSPYYAQSIRHQLEELGYENWQIGHIAAGPTGVVWA